jgi:hypothetical protein
MRVLLAAMMLMAVSGCARKEPTMTSRWYDFRFAGERAGWFELHESPGELSENAVFQMDGKVWENPFGVRHAGGRVTAYRCTPDTWIAAPAGGDRYPTSAFPLLVPRVRDRVAYTEINEGTGAEQPAEMVRTGDVVETRTGGKVATRFHLDPDGTIRSIEWGGGATSTLVAGEAEAKAGLPFPH